MTRPFPTAAKTLAWFSCVLLVALVQASRGSGEELINKVYDPLKTKSEIRITALASQLPTSGYMAVRVYIRNATRIPRTWRLDFTSTDAPLSNDGNTMSSDFTLSCNAGQSRTFEILVPLVTAFRQDYSDDTTELRVTASAPGFPTLNSSMETSYSSDWPSVLISDELNQRNGGLLAPEVHARLGMTRHGGTSTIEFGASFSPRQMSSDWKAYSGFDFCLLTESDWLALGPGPQSALLRWNRLGGALVIYAEDASTDLATLGIPQVEPGPKSQLRSWGIVRIEPLPSSKLLPPAATVNLLAKEIPTTVGSHTLHVLRDDFYKTWPLQRVFGSKTAHVVLFIIILLAFGILVGPINLFVFAKAGQRHRLFITTPIISLAASLILVALILLQDGFGGRGQQLVLMEVRAGEGENAAYLCQEQVCRTGVLLSTGFTTSEPCYLSQALLEESRWARATKVNDGGNSRYTVDVRDEGLKVTGEWFKSRSEHGHYLEAVRPSRGRIELKSQAGPPQITSTFSFPLSEVVFTDNDGNHWTAREVGQGRATTMTPLTPEAFREWKNSQKELFSKRNRARIDMTVGRRGHFAATSPAVETISTLTTASWRDNHALITGSVLTN